MLYLDLSTFAYPLTPPISNLNWLSDLSYLKYLSLNGVNLSEAKTDWLLTINLLPSLLELHLSFCLLHYLPQCFPSVNFSSLSKLDISGNDFNPSILQLVFNITSLKYLNLNYVDLSKATTDWLQTVNLLPSLLELHLSDRKSVV